MYYNKASTKKSIEKYKQKKKIVNIVHLSNGEPRVLCGRVISWNTEHSAGIESTTCSRCRKLLGLSALSFSNDGTSRKVRAAEIHLKNKIESIGNEIRKLEDQLKIAEILLASEIKDSEEEVVVC